MSNGVVGASRAAAALDTALDQLEALQRDKAALDAREQRLLAAIETLDAVANPDTRWARESVSAILRCAPVTARSRLAAARTLVDELPATLDALATARITPAHARVALEAITVLTADRVAEFEAQVLPRAEGRSVAEFRRVCTRAVLAVDPAGAERRHQVALADRHVRFQPAGDGMTDLYAHLSDPDAARIRQHLDACAEKLRRDKPTEATRSADTADAEGFVGIDALRADVLVTLCTGDPGDPARTRPVEVVVAVSTLLGQDDAPGEIDGNPAAANLVRALAHDPCAWWRPVLIDRDGHLETVGARRYRPSALLELTVKLHDRTCQFPGCGRRATRSETDHVVPFDHVNPAAGGLTVPANLHTLCKRHHRLKHEAGWTVIRKDGITHWRSPAGRRYSKPAYDYVNPPPTREPLRGPEFVRGDGPWRAPESDRGPAPPPYSPARPRSF